MSYTTLCAVVCLAVLCSLAAAHPQPGSNSNNGRENRYLESQPAAQNRVDQSSDEGEAILTAKPPDEDKRYINSRLVEASIAAGFAYFTYHILRPEHFFFDTADKLNFLGLGRASSNAAVAGSDQHDDLFSRLYSIVINSLDPVEMGLKYLAVEEKECKQRLVCEARQMVARVPVLESMAHHSGWLLGPVTAYEEALQTARNHTNCGYKYRHCRVTPLTTYYQLL